MNLFSAKVAVFIATLFFFSSVNSNDFKPYVGAKVSHQSINFHELYGEPLFNHNASAPALFGGVRITPNVAIEASYECSRAVNGVNCVGENQFLPGCQQAQGKDTFQTLKTSVRTSALDVSVIGFFYVDFKTKLGAGAGASLFNVLASQELLHDNLPGVPPQDIVDLSRRTYKIREVIPFLTLSVEHMFHENLSARVSVNWKITNGLQAKSNEYPDRQAEIRLKDTTGVSAGMFYSF